MSDETEPQEAPVAKPILRVVKGDLTPEELAALVAVIAVCNAAAANAAEQRSTPKIRSAWSHPAAMVRAPHRHGPDQWRRSTFGG